MDRDMEVASPTEGRMHEEEYERAEPPVEMR
jgi:hypothetical protein